MTEKGKIWLNAFEINTINSARWMYTIKKTVKFGWKLFY